MANKKTAQKAPKRQKRDYERLKKEYIAGFFEQKWKSVLEFAKKKGVDPKNGSWKQNTKGWQNDAIEEKDAFDNRLGSVVADNLLSAIGNEWMDVYKSLNNVAIELSKKLENFVCETTFTSEENEGNNTVYHFDSRSVKDCAVAGYEILLLLKNTTVNTNIPLAVENMHKIETDITKAKKMQGLDKMPLTDPLDGLTLEECEREIAKLEGSGDNNEITAGELVKQSKQIYNAALNGKITTKQAHELNSVLEGCRKSIELNEIEKRLEELEDGQK